MIKNIGKFGEYLVLSELLKNNIEAYPAISFNQEDYDITIILDDGQVIRLQVKTTELWNDSTNNPIDGIDKNYDFLIILVIDKKDNNFHFLSREEALKERGMNKKLATKGFKTVENDKIYKISDNISSYEITDFINFLELIKSKQ